MFLIILGMSLELFSQLTGKPIRARGWNVAVPYLWMLGLFIFSPAMMYGGLLGQPRRTNMGLSYLDPSSPHFRADWVPTAYLAGIGAAIMTLAFVIYLGVWIATLAGQARQPAGQLYFPTAESLLPDAPISSIAAKLRPWLVIALLLIVISYWEPMRQAMRTPENAVPYEPDNPVPLIQTRR